MMHTNEGRAAALQDAYTEKKINATQLNALLKKFGLN